MLDVKKLLTKFCTEIKSLKDWMLSYLSTVQKLSTYGKTLEASLTDSVELTTGDWTEICSISLPKGRWIVSGYVRFPSNATGDRFVNIHTASATSGGSATSSLAISNSSMKVWCQTQLTIRETDIRYYLNAYQNSGATLTVTVAKLQAIKISDNS